MVGFVLRCQRSMNVKSRALSYRRMIEEHTTQPNTYKSHISTEINFVMTQWDLMRYGGVNSIVNDRMINSIFIKMIDVAVF